MLKNKAQSIKFFGHPYRFGCHKICIIVLKNLVHGKVIFLAWKQKCYIIGAIIQHVLINTSNHYWVTVLVVIFSHYLYILYSGTRLEYKTLKKRREQNLRSKWLFLSKYPIIVSLLTLLTYNSMCQKRLLQYEGRIRRIQARKFACIFTDAVGKITLKCEHHM